MERKITARYVNFEADLEFYDFIEKNNLLPIEKIKHHKKLIKNLLKKQEEINKKDKQMV